MYVYEVVLGGCGGIWEYVGGKESLGLYVGGYLRECSVCECPGVLGNVCGESPWKLWGFSMVCV